MSKQTVTQQTPMTSPLFQGGILQRQCASCGQHASAEGSISQQVEKFFEPTSKRLSFNNDFSRIKVGQISPVSKYVSDALNSTSQPIPETTRTRLVSEGIPERSLTDIRLHTDDKASQSAQILGARAYQFGTHIVFKANYYQPHTQEGNALLRHEVAHVLQSKGRQSSTFEIASTHSFLEDQAQSFARYQMTNYQQFSSASSAIHLTRDPRLGAVLEQIRNMPVPYTPQAKAERIYALLQGINLNDSDNLTPVIATIEETFALFERGEILTRFLAMVDANAPTRALPQEYVPSAEDEARMQATIQSLQVGPRGPYRQYGVGVTLPVLSQPARHLVPLVEGIGNAFAGAGAFLQGVLIGLQSAMTEAEREQLARRLFQSSVLSSVFPIVFVAGAVVGILEDVVEAVKGIYRLLSDFRQFVSEMTDLVRVLIGPESRTIGRAMGEQVGRDYGTRIAVLARGNIFVFTYGLGRMIGPTIVYTILGLLGVPELVASALVSRLMNILSPLLQRFPRLVAIAERISLRLVRQSTHQGVDELEADLERAFRHTFTEPARPRPVGSPTARPPEVTAGFAARYLAAFRRLLGKPMTHTDISDIARVWNSVANPGETATLTLQNSRQLFDNHRNRFWRAVRADQNARRLFEEAGCVFEGGSSTAPFYRLPDGSRFQMTIDHIVERQTNPSRTLDPANLRIVSRRENTVLLRQLHAQDPFLR